MKRMPLCLIYCFLLFGSFFHTTSLAAGSQLPAHYGPVRRQVDSLNARALKLSVAAPAKTRDVAAKALLLAKQIHYANGIGQSFYAIGYSYWAQSYYPISLFYLNSALPYFKHDASWLSDCYRDIGRNYMDLKKYPEPLSFLKKAEQSAGSDPELISKVLVERSLAYIRQKDYDRATADALRAISILKKINQQVTLAIVYNRLFIIYEHKKRFDLAKVYCDTCYRMSVATHNNRLRAISYFAYAVRANDMGQPIVAIEYAKKAAALADSVGVIEFATNARKLLTTIYQKEGDGARELFYTKQYVALQDSLNQIDKQNSLALIQDYFALNAKLNDIEQLEQKNKLEYLQIRTQSNTIVSLAVLLFALIVSLFVLYKYYKQKHKLALILATQHAAVTAQNKIIASQSQHLEQLNHLKDRMLAIIGHDLNAPLANLRTLVDLFNQGDFAADEVQLMMREIDPAIKGAELTLSNLVAWAASQFRGNTVNQTTVDLMAVMQEMEHVFAHPLNRKNLALENFTAGSQKVWADENHIKMILRNLISNAIKFTPSGGKITVFIKAPDKGKITIAVRDTGIGIQPQDAATLFSSNSGFSKPGTQGEKGTGLGLLLCRQLAELNGGDLSVDSAPGVGTTFYLTLATAVS